jgi:3-carboxy-cis,cis-muconate cycloisomerase
MISPVYSLFDHPHFSSLLNTGHIDELFTLDAEVSAMLRFEETLAAAQAEFDLVPAGTAEAISRAVRTQAPVDETLAAGVRRDGVVVPALVDWLRQAVGPDYAGHVHFGATSQDAIDTGLMIRVSSALGRLGEDLASLTGALTALSDRSGENRIMGRTRMQRALPIAFADRIATWRSPLDHHLQSLDGLKGRVCAVQLGGAVGTLEKLGSHGPDVRAALATRLGLADPGRAWHAERDRIADLAHWLSGVSGSLGKIGQDLALMAQNEVAELSLENGGRSSAMPHKRNPVHAEILVTLARFNAGQNALIHQAMVHEGERSGAAWTLEWLVLPQMMAATTASLSLGRTCLESVRIPPP